MTEITDEQRAAYLEVVSESPTFAVAWSLIAPLLPSELTNSQPVLPTEPGVYEDKYGDIWRKWDKQSDGMDRLVDGVTPNGNPNAPDYAPFTRLVQERPGVDREKLIAVLYGLDGRDYALTEDGRYADAILALVNGTHGA